MFAFVVLFDACGILLDVAGRSLVGFGGVSADVAGVLVAGRSLVVAVDVVVFVAVDVAVSVVLVVRFYVVCVVVVLLGAS